jgi:Uncharacterized ACR, COG1678
MSLYSAHTIVKLYRAQLRTALFYDKNPLLKSLLTIPNVTYISSSAAGDAIEKLRRAVFSDFGYQPGTQLSKFVKEKYRESIVLRKDEREEEVTRELFDVAFNAQRVLVFIADAAVKLLQVKEHLIELPESMKYLNLVEASALSPGVLAAEHPSIIGPGRGLYFVYDISQNISDLHGNENWMVRTYCINRPFPKCVEDVTKITNLGAFGKLPLFYGGQNDSDKLSVIHKHKFIEGAAPVDDGDSGLFVGGSVEHINKLLDDGVVQSGDFKVILGNSQWELEKQDDGGLYLPSSNNYLLLSGDSIKDCVLQVPLLEKLDEVKNNEVKGYNYNKFWHQNLTWKAVIEAFMKSIKDSSGNENEISQMAELHVAIPHYIASGLPLTYKAHDALVETDQ